MPVAATVKVTFTPAQTVCDTGFVVIVTGWFTVMVTMFENAVDGPEEQVTLSR